MWRVTTQGVDDIVQLLEHIGGQQRQAQADQLGRDGSGGEFGLSGHGETSPSVIGAASIIVRNLPFVNGREKRAAIWDAFQGSAGKNGDLGGRRQDAAKSARDIPYNWDI